MMHTIFALLVVTSGLVTVRSYRILSVDSKYPAIIAQSSSNKNKYPRLGFLITTKTQPHMKYTWSQVCIQLIFLTNENHICFSKQIRGIYLHEVSEDKPQRSRTPVDQVISTKKSTILQTTTQKLPIIKNDHIQGPPQPITLKFTYPFAKDRRLLVQNDPIHSNHITATVPSNKFTIQDSIHWYLSLGTT